MPGAPVRLSTGVMVIYADEESFTFMTPEGHTLSAWITFSAYRDGSVTVAQAQALERPSDPLDELTYMLGGKQYIVVAIGGTGYEAEFIAFRLPN